MNRENHPPESRKEEAKRLYEEYYRSMFIEPSEEEVKLASMPFRERVSYMKVKGERAKLLLAGTLNELKLCLADTDPLVLLATLVFHDMSFGGINREWEEDDPLLMYHVELLQALVLQRVRSDFSADKNGLRDAAGYVAVGGNIKELARLYLRSADADLDPDVKDSERAARRVSKCMQVQTQIVRNWGSMPQIIRIVTGLFASVEEGLHKQTGVRVRDLLAMIQNILALVDCRGREHNEGLKSVRGAESFLTAQEAFGKHFPDVWAGTDEYRHHLEEAPEGLDVFKRILTMKAFSELAAVYTFTLDDFIDAYPGAVEPAKLRRVFDEVWSLPFGGAAGIDVDDLFLGNPVWERPLIRLSADTYFCAALWAFVAFCIELMENVLRSAPKLFGKYEAEYKGRFLEQETERLFRKALPAAQISCGNIGEVKTHGENLENDLIAILGSCALVVEAKAHRVTPRGRKGYHDRLKTKVGELLVNPSEQSIRFVAYLRRHPGLLEFRSKKGGKNQIDSSGIREYVRLNVTLESLGSIGTHTPSLRSAGLIDAPHNIAPTLALSDLETVLDLLGGTCEKFHYFIRRARVDREEDYIADELDLLYAYLKTGLNFEYQRRHRATQYEGGKDTWLLSRNSRYLNPYLMREVSGQDVPKPRREFTPWWRRLIRQVERETPPRWVEAGCVLLNAALEDQVVIEGGLLRMRKEVVGAHRTRNIRKLKQMIYRPVGGGNRPDGLAVFAHGNMPRDLFNRLTGNSKQFALSQTLSDRAVVLGVDVSQHGHPYSFIEYIEKGV
jgi:hypothetical protein